MSETHQHTPHETAQRLGVSASTLRRWSVQFAEYLSAPAGDSARSVAGGHPHRRYTDDDIAVLLVVKGLVAEGKSYDQTRQHLQMLSQRGSDQPQTALSALTPAALPAVTFLSETLHTVADGQQLLLNSQQASRDLLNVAIQDNFNLKEENARLRERMMHLEQELSENRRREETRREMLERRLERLEDRTYGPTPADVPDGPVQHAQPKRRQGWLARLLGLWCISLLR